MNFGLDDDQILLQETVRAFCSTRADLGTLARREGKRADDELWCGLGALGVLGLLGPDSGGLGIVEACLAFEVFGERLTMGPVLWSVLAAPLVDGVADGDVRVTGIERCDVAVAPVLVEHLNESDQLLLLGPDGVELHPVASIGPGAVGAPIDPLTPVGVIPALPHGPPIAGRDVAERLRLLGTILSAASLVGVAQGALDIARSYAMERAQFGKPIGSFQAIKHMLADMFVRVELARSSAYAAAATAADPSVGDPGRAASAAKLLAGEAGIANGRAAVQILGGMGFTWDMLPHYFLKRAWVLENAFRTTSYHAVSLAEALDAEVAERGPDRPKPRFR